MPFSVGQRIDRFTLVSVLGEGGQGAVWKADDPVDGEVRALKLVPIGKSTEVELERMRREARTLAKLDHPSLVACHGIFEDLKEGVLGLVMEMVEGSSLHRAQMDPRFDDRRKLLAMRHVAGALAMLHEQHLVHRDLKLENVLVTKSFRSNPEDPSNVRLVDFGIAATVGNPNPLTATHQLIGTPAYIAPELLEPRHWGGDGATAAADVFSFGVLLWKLLLGGHPADLPDRSTVTEFAVAYREVQEGEKPWTDAAPAGPVGDLLKACLELDPKDRLPDGAALVERLDDIVPAPSVSVTESNPSLTSTPSSTEPTSRSAFGRWIVAVATLLVGAALVVVLMGGLNQDDPPTDEILVVSAVPTEQPAPPPSSAPPGPEFPGWACSGQCPSGNGCGAFCKQPLPDGEVLQLRLAGVRVTGDEKDLSKAHPSATACFRVAGSKVQPQCFVLEEAGMRTAAFLEVTAEQLENPGIEIRVLLGSAVLGRATKRFKGGVLRSGVCSGMRYRGGFGKPDVLDAGSPEPSASPDAAAADGGDASAVAPEPPPEPQRLPGVQWVEVFLDPKSAPSVCPRAER